MIKFKTTSKDRLLIKLIAQRAKRTFKNDAWKLKDWEMDFTACHLNGTPLDLEALLKADNFNFAHDAAGIRRHLNREDGKLDESFSPRFSAKASA